MSGACLEKYRARQETKRNWTKDCCYKVYFFYITTWLTLLKPSNRAFALDWRSVCLPFPAPSSIASAIFFHIIVFISFLSSPSFLSQTHTVHHSPSVRLYGCCGAWFLTTLCPCRTQRAPPVSSSCQCGPSSPSSSWPRTRQTWPPSWSRSNTSTRCRGCRTRR